MGYPPLPLLFPAVCPTVSSSIFHADSREMPFNTAFPGYTMRVLKLTMFRLKNATSSFDADAIM
ncbi:hypothetical protein D3Z45_00320 [Lachnospiraceae bacterium]|nr:hypothetical protein [Lachnospiraceae bacterium]